MFLYTPHDSEAGIVGTAREFYIFFIDCCYTKLQPLGVNSPKIVVEPETNCIQLQDQRHVVGDYSQWAAGL